MGMRIQQLPPLIANQIAAGEVIERPASVVKELLENCLDAGASLIAIDIGYGGLNHIKISDNGIGIIAEDLPLAIAAHATSKINTLDDLYAINSMGFRGEALASIVSVAKVTISSKPAHQETAMRLSVQGIDAITEPCAHNEGTTIEVRDLFFNTPVRKKFLKSEKLEFQAIEMVVKRFALSAPKISLTLKHNGKQILALPAATTEQAQITRMTRLFGSAFVKEAVFVDVDHDAMKLSGWISNLNFQRSQNDRLWVYINQRMVKDKLIHQALKQTYDGLLHPGRFPACVLYLTMNHAEVDVNVHPTKHEVRFQQPRLVFDFLTTQLQRALTVTVPTKEQTIKTSTHESAKQQGQSLFEPVLKWETCKPQKQYIENNAPWVMLNAKYALIFINQEPLMVDLINLYQKMVQNQLSQLSVPLASRPLLVPVCYLFTGECLKNRIELSQSLSQLGINLEWQGDCEAIIRTIPLCMPYLDLNVFLKTVCSLVVLVPNQLPELMIHAQVLDPRLFSVEEKLALNEFLHREYSNENNKIGLFRKLRLQECDHLVHACMNWNLI